MIKLHIVIGTIISTSDIISSSSFTVPREQRNSFVTRYVQVLFHLNSTMPTQFTAPLTFGLKDQTTCTVKYSINNTELGIIIQTSLTLKCGVEKPKGPLSQKEEKSRYQLSLQHLFHVFFKKSNDTLA